jgi:hypothetical protein
MGSLSTTTGASCKESSSSIVQQHMLYTNSRGLLFGNSPQIDTNTSGKDAVQAYIDAVEELLHKKEEGSSIDSYGSNGIYEEAPLRSEPEGDSAATADHADTGLDHRITWRGKRGKSRFGRELENLQDSASSFHSNQCDEQSLPSLVSYDLNGSAAALSKSDSLSNSFDGFSMVSSCSTLMRSLREMLDKLDLPDSDSDSDESCGQVNQEECDLQDANAEEEEDTASLPIHRKQRPNLTTLDCAQVVSPLDISPPTYFETKE